MDEAVADVYGLLNVGPQFALNLTAFFSALTARAFIDAGRQPPPLPFMRTDSLERDPDNGDFNMDEHPTDTLRIHLAIAGVGDDAQLLAGATAALAADPGSYDAVTKRLNDALDTSFARDPIWGPSAPDLMFAPSFLRIAHAPPQRRVDPGVEEAAPTGAATDIGSTGSPPLRAGTRPASRQKRSQ